ncbi:MAG: hypothetical protein IJH92_02180 [Mogibacterium sp.]|nr:hypothetical protein [Mogibacterium sp.]
MATADSRGGTMRLGSYPCALSEESPLPVYYGTDMITERHRHRYEFNNRYNRVKYDKNSMSGHR